MSDLSETLAIAAVIFGVPGIAYGLIERASRRRWREEGVVRVETHAVGQGAWRAGTVMQEVRAAVREKAPFGVRVASFTSLFECSTLVPGTLCWIVGVLVALDGRFPWWGMIFLLSYFPGAVAAVLAGAAGVALLRRKRARADRATWRAAWFITVHNVALMGLCAVALALENGRHGEVAVMLAPLCYAPFSILQAQFARAMFVKHQDTFIADAAVEANERRAAQA
jgi:hypothetical protein